MSTLSELHNALLLACSRAEKCRASGMASAEILYLNEATRIRVKINELRKAGS